MSLRNVVKSSAFILISLLFLQVSHAQKDVDLSPENEATHTHEIMNIVDPSEVCGTVVLIKDLI